MHIPDGFLSVNTWGTLWLISAGGVMWCLRKTSHILKDKMIPLMGVMAAFIFAAQMLNFPVIGGTSGHLVGSVLACVLLGPYAGVIVIAIVLITQCLIFQDGGLTALGANIFNMSFLGAMGGYFIYRLMRRIIKGNIGIIIGTGVAAWASVVIASSAVAVELAISGTSPLRVVFPTMAGVYMLTGIAEAIISCLVVSFVLRVRQDLIYNG